MASDYGDESGEKMLDNFYRFGERMGVVAMRERAGKLHEAFENAKQGAASSGKEEQAAPEFAKLDMAEFKEIEGYEQIREIVGAKLKSHGVEPVWFTDSQDGHDYLIFSIKDAHEVWESFDELSHETLSAAEEAAQALHEKTRDVEHEHGKDTARQDKTSVNPDKRPLEVRAKQAREASAALEAQRFGDRAKEHAPRFEELRSK